MGTTVEDTVYAVHFWAKDTRNHLYLRAELDDPVRATHEAQCTRGHPIPGRWAFRDELSEELGESRDRSRDCGACFRRLR